MENLKSPLIINLLILLAYSVLIRLEVTIFEHVQFNNLTIALYSMFAIGIQVIINLALGLKIFSAEPEKRKSGKQYLVCAFLVLLIGFSTCVVNTEFL